MTTPGEGLPDEQRLLDVGVPNEGIITDEEFKNIPRTGHFGWVDPVFKLGLAAIGIGGLGAGGYAIYEGTNQHSSAKQPARSAPDPYPNTTFMSNIDMTNLPFVTDKAGPVPDQNFNFRMLRADEVDSSAVCQTTDPTKYVSEPAKTIVIYRSDAPKKGFKQVWPSVGEKTALAHVTLYSHEFPNKFKDGVRIGKSKAARLAREVKQDLCVEEGSFVGYKDQHIRQILPESQGLFGPLFGGGDINITPKDVAMASLLTLMVIEAGLAVGAGAKNKDTSEWCMRALSAQLKFIPSRLAKLRGRASQEGEVPTTDDEMITWPPGSPDAVAEEVKPEPNQDWGFK